MTNAECRTRRRMRALSAFSIRHWRPVALPPHRDRSADATAANGGVNRETRGRSPAIHVLGREDRGVDQRADAAAPDRSAHERLEDVLAAAVRAADRADQDEGVRDARANRGAVPDGVMR